MTRKLLLVAALLLALAAITGGIAIAAGGGGAAGIGEEQPLTGATLERATAAALAHTGGGTVTETETGDDGGAYGVEVRLANGRQVEVSLGENFDVLGREQDDDGAGKEDSSSDD